MIYYFDAFENKTEEKKIYLWLSLYLRVRLNEFKYVALFRKGTKCKR